MVFLDVNTPLRTDSSFSENSYPEHYTGTSFLSVLPIGLVSQLLLSYFHLLLLGVMRKLLNIWLLDHFIYLCHDAHRILSIQAFTETSASKPEILGLKTIGFSIL